MKIQIHLLFREQPKTKTQHCIIYRNHLLPIPWILPRLDLLTSLLCNEDFHYSSTCCSVYATYTSHVVEDVDIFWIWQRKHTNTFTGTGMTPIKATSDTIVLLPLFQHKMIRTSRQHRWWRWRQGEKVMFVSFSFSWLDTSLSLIQVTKAV